MQVEAGSAGWGGGEAVAAPSVPESRKALYWIILEMERKKNPKTDHSNVKNEKEP